MRCRKLQPTDRTPCLWWGGTKVIQDKEIPKEFIAYGFNSKLFKESVQKVQKLLDDISATSDNDTVKLNEE